MVCYDGAGHLVVRYQLDLAIMSGHSGGVGGARVDHLVEVAVVEVAVVVVEVVVVEVVVVEVVVVVEMVVLVLV